MVGWLLDSRADLDQVTDDGTTALHIAWRKGHAEIASMLLDAGADKDRARSKDGATPLILAAQHGNLEITRLLLNAGADKEKARQNGGETPLMVASQRQHTEVVRLLSAADAGADAPLPKRARLS